MYFSCFIKDMLTVSKQYLILSKCVSPIFFSDFPQNPTHRKNISQPSCIAGFGALGLTKGSVCSQCMRWKKRR
jgi:hypothetical protein